MHQSSALIEYLGTLTLAGGDCDGQRLTVLPWERRFVRGAFGVDGESALSVGRGNGKSAICAGLAVAVVDPSGPLHGARRHVLCVASSFGQARIIFEDCLAFLAVKHDLDDRKVWRVQDSQNVATIEHRPSRSLVKCIGSDPKRSHGARPYLVLCDEPAQWDAGKRDAMLASLRTSLGKMPESRLVALGTRSAARDHWFEGLLRTAAYSQVHSADADDPPFTVRTIRRANPSWDHLPSLRARVLAERDDARRDAMSLPAYRALRLNQGVHDTDIELLIEAETWRRATGDAPVGDVCYWGVDVGEKSSGSAIAAFWPDTGRLDAFAAFPEIPDLAQRGARDHVGPLYRRMADRGELLTLGRKVIDVKALVREGIERFGVPAAISCDDYRVGALEEALDDLMVTEECEIDLRRQGFISQGQDIEAFRTGVIGGAVVPTDTLLLAHAIAGARLRVDDAANRKIGKSEAGRRRRHRDDAAVAAVLVVGLADREYVADTGARQTFEVIA